MDNQPTALDIAIQSRDQWQGLFYWAVGGLATGGGALMLYLKGIIAELTTAKMEAARGDLAQAESNKAVAAALTKMAEAVESGS